MNKKLIITAVLVSIIGTSSMAQEKLFNGINIQSPVKNADRPSLLTSMLHKHRR